MTWRDEYQRKLVSPAEAVKAVQSGHRVLLGSTCSEPQTLTEALLDDKDRLEQVELVTTILGSKAGYASPAMEGHFRVVTFRPDMSVRDATRAGRIHYLPCLLSEAPRLFSGGYLPVDVAMVQLSPPDDKGYCSFSLSIDYTQPAAEAARIVVAEINRQTPRTLGDTFIHISKLHYIIESDRAPIQVAPAPLGQPEKAIGEHVAGLIPDGATLQVGVGAIPDAVLASLSGRKDLGVHSGMLSEGMIDLARAGVINGRRKAINPGVMVATCLVGTDRLYQFANDNHQVELYPSSYTHSPLTLSRLDNLIAINSALQVDLWGQVNAEMVGGVQMSGVGGQLDFVRGASLAPGGKSVMALLSTAGNGRHSRIVSHLDPGAPVTTSRAEVHYVVTEYGLADLRGKTLRERAKALISIAHPSFRESLEKASRAES
ncbi:MAG: acetyl-CoA hydrolase/transferase C-terminal domain-containing protein [Dehalococcoidia bacterium]|nr:acetyl-CoA hydrolase/transferase C-terminal domain-containing protein [Dehalococcoidia bacterium]